MPIHPSPSARASASDACPYVGLSPYQECDKDRFFGRDAEISALLVRHAEVGDEPLVLVGPAGSGKTSLLFAGLLPQLREEAENMGQELRVHHMVPSRYPLEALAKALGSRQVQADAEAFSRSTEQALHLARVETGPTLLIVDQLEELFALCSLPDRQEAFANALVDLARDKEAQATVVLALRSEEEAHLSALPQLQALMRGGVLRLPPLSPVNLRHVIERPAHSQTVSFESGVVQRLIDEVEGEFAALPLLQFTLLALWQRRQDSLISMAAFEEVGGPRRALEKAAEAVFSKLLQEEVPCARRIFGRLVQSGEAQGRGDFVRRRALRSELRSLDDPSRVDRVMAPFVAARLLSQRPIERDAVVEITHESLIRAWPRLAGWLEDSRHHLRQHALLKDAIQRWREGKEDPADLLSQGRIGTFSELVELDAEDRRFLKLSAEHWRHVAERSAQRRRMAVVGIIAVAVLAAGGWWLAWRAEAGGGADGAEAQQTGAATAGQQRQQNADATLRALRQQLEAQRTLAAKARREADLTTAKSVALQQKLEIARDQLRGNLVAHRGRELAEQAALVGLAERALPDLSGLLRPTEAGVALSDQLAEARKQLKEIKLFSAPIAARVALLDKTVNSKEQRRDDTSQKQLRVARLQVKQLKERLRWFEQQLAVRKGQLELAQGRARERGHESASARARRLDLVRYEASLRPFISKLRQLAAQLPTDAEALRSAKNAAKKAGKGATTKTKQTPEQRFTALVSERLSSRSDPRERAAVRNAAGVALYRAHRYRRAQAQFAKAAQAATARRGAYLTNQAWALFQLALSKKREGKAGVERAKLLRRADGLAHEAERTTPRASALRAKIHTLRLMPMAPLDAATTPAAKPK